MKYLLFFSTIEQAPINSSLHNLIQHKLGKAGNAKNIAFWNWTCGQKSILDADEPRMMFTADFSTGKTRLMVEKAKQLAQKEGAVEKAWQLARKEGRKGKKPKEVLFVAASTDDIWHQPLLLTASLENEFEFDTRDTGRGRVKVELRHINTFKGVANYSERILIHTSSLMNCALMVLMNLQYQMKIWKKSENKKWKILSKQSKRGKRRHICGLPSPRCQVEMMVMEP